MTDRALSVSLGTAAAMLLWAATVAMLAWDWAYDEERLGQAALACSAAAATATIRQYHVRTNRLIRMLMVEQAERPRRLR